jgi:hypothetical protein
MCEHYIKKNKAWIRSLESIKAKNLIISIIEGDKILRKLIKFQLASKRTEILFNSKEAGKIFEFQVQTHTKRFTSNLHKQELLFNRFLEEMKPQEESWIEFIKSGKVKDHFKYARNFMILRTIYSDISPKDSEYLIKQIDAKMEKIQSLTSIDEVKRYFGNVFELKLFIDINWEEIFWKACVVRWSLTGEIEVLMIIWAFYCAWVSRQDDPEVTCLEWWDNAMYEACGVPHGDFDWEWFEGVLERIGNM